MKNNHLIKEIINQYNFLELLSLEENDNDLEIIHNLKNHLNSLDDIEKYFINQKEFNQDKEWK